jgi:hypothetical protein
MNRWECLGELLQCSRGNRFDKAETVARKANNKGFLKHKEALLLCDGISEYRTFQ